MHLYNNTQYQNDIAHIATLPICWDRFQNTTILISGATGLIGSFLIDVLMYKNEKDNLACTILALGRNQEKANYRFHPYLNNERFYFFPCDITQTLPNWQGVVDYIIHAASNTHPVAYATDPIGTITTNVLGTKNLLDYAVEHQTKRTAFLSSVEIYGENRGDVEQFSEFDCGYINCNSLRAGYPESKRAGEALCQAYIHQKGLDIVIPRLSRTFGPTLQKDDTKAMSQFLQNAIAGKDIVLKSSGTQFFSYNYVADSVSGILYCLMYGQCGEAYNIADANSNITLKDLATRIAGYVGRKVVFELPDAVECTGFSKATVAVMSSAKLNNLGWKASYGIDAGIQQTIDILQQIK